MAEYWGFDPVEGNAFFTSYNSREGQRVSPIVKELFNLGYPVWYDYGLEAGTRAWRTQISMHIDSALAVVLFVTKGIFERDKSYVITEYNEATDLEKVVIPVFLDEIRLKDVDPKYRSYVTEWEDLQGVKGIGKDNAAIAREIAEKINRSNQIAFTHTVSSKTSSKSIHSETEEEMRARIIKELRAEEDQKKAAEAKTNFEKQQNPKVGDIIKFGSYPQTSSTPEPIEWQVLSVENSKALLVSKYGLDCVKYNEMYRPVTWETCTLRAWLNKDFINKAFTAQEQQKIAAERILNADNPKHRTSGGIDTEDKVFCLSIDEAEKLFKSDIERICVPTAYAKKKGAHQSNTAGFGGWWWLRSPGIYEEDAAYVIYLGFVSRNGDNVASGDVSVRPALYINL